MFLENLNPQEQMQNRLINIKLEPDDVKGEIEVNINCKFWELVRKSSLYLNCKMNEIYILTKNGPLQDDMYQACMKNYDIKEITFERMSVEKQEKEFPNY